MSGFGGILHFDARPVEEEILESMIQRLLHRGPDGTGKCTRSGLGLVHTQLFSTPESLFEKQPVISANGQVVLVADARIDNRNELRNALDISETLMSSVSDAELIVAAYDRWGEECVGRLIGDFSFALWDARDQKLFCARDRFGVRPLYYWYSASCGFVFGSEVKALWAAPGVPRDINPQSVVDYIADRVHDATQTFYADIFSLSPAHTLTVTAGRMSTRCYWTPDPLYELRLRRDSEYVEAFREVFKESVRCRLRSHTPVAIALSGGIDSSSIACMTRTLSTGPEAVRTFSATYSDDPGADERPYIDEIVRMGGFDSHFINVRNVSPLESLDAILYHEDGPFDNPLFSGGWHFRRAMNLQSVRVLLDGHAGDSTLTYDWGYLADLTRRLCLIQLYREAKGLSDHYFLKERSAHQIAWRFGVRPVLARLSGRRPPIPAPRAAHCRLVTHPLLARDLETSNKADSAFQIESRHPFLDARLVAFCISLPREQLVNKGWTRFILRRALDGVLPRSNQWRGSKWTPNGYLATGFLKAERETLTTFFATRLKTWEPVLEAWGMNVDQLRETFLRYSHDPTVKDAYSVWMIVVLCRWLASGGSGASSAQDVLIPHSLEAL